MGEAGEAELHQRMIESIRIMGLLRPPTVTPDLVVIDGIRRVKAAIAAGLTEIEIQVVEVSEEDLQFLFEHANKVEHAHDPHEGCSQSR